MRECGLRCPYHGWKFDVTGQCIEVPSEPEESGFAKRIKLKSYPLVERGGVLWAYLGPPERQPPLPEWEIMGGLFLCRWFRTTIRKARC